MIIVLMGYMGSGKSSVGQLLASALSYNFIDLDDFIEQNEKQLIVDIFKTKGEIYFRKKETEYLRPLLSSESNLVLALGGGTPCYGNNLEAILNTKNVKSFYLKASISELEKRLSFEKQKRPLISHLKSDEALIEFLGKHLFERIQYYSKAEVTIRTDNKSINKIVEEIVLQLV